MPVLIFDPNITTDSPIGSCLLKMLLALIGTRPVRVFVRRTDLPDHPLLRKIKLPIPGKPVFASAILYTLVSSCAYVVYRPTSRRLTISTEGALPFCDISYNQFCHRYFLLHHRSALAGWWLRRWARVITHTWGAMMEKIALRSARAIVVPSQGLARELASQYPRSVVGKIKVIANPVDVRSFSRPDDFSPIAIRSRFVIAPEIFLLSFCALGGFERKGLRFVLEALAELRDTNVQLLVIGGSSTEISEYQTLSKSLGVNQAIHFAGLQKDIRPYLWSSQAFVFPSAYEGFALACLQAAAAGLPLITTSINGTEEFVRHGINGWIVERSAASVAAAIREAASSVDRTAAMGQAAKEDVQNYRQELFQARWLALLEEQSAKLAKV